MMAAQLRQYRLSWCRASTRCSVQTKPIRRNSQLHATAYKRAVRGQTHKHNHHHVANQTAASMPSTLNAQTGKWQLLPATCCLAYIDRPTPMAATLLIIPMPRKPRQCGTHNAAAYAAASAPITCPSQLHVTAAAAAAAAGSRLSRRQSQSRLHTCHPGAQVTCHTCHMSHVHTCHMSPRGPGYIARIAHARLSPGGSRYQLSLLM
jgi:hypothetical protein